MSKLKLPDGKTIAEQLDDLAENEVKAQATTSDGKTADVRAEFQRTTKKGTEIAVFGEATLGAGKPKNLKAGVEVRKKLGKRK